MKLHWLISRTDRLGDLLLTLPMGNFIQKHLPEIEPIFLVSSYAAPLVARHDPPFQYIVWSKGVSLKGYDAIIHAFPRSSIAWAALRVGIPVRVGTRRRWYHWLTCTHRPSISRRFSGRHEAALNLALLAPLLPAELRSAVLDMSWEQLLPYRARLRTAALFPSFLTHLASSDRPSVVLHIGSGGGAPLWPHWQSLAQLLIERFPRALLIFTGNDREKSLIEGVVRGVSRDSYIDTAGKLSLDELISLIAHAALVIAGSTGPLHIAAAVSTPAIGLYPATAAMGPWRWRPLSPLTSVLSQNVMCAKCEFANCHCLARIRPTQVIELVETIIAQRFPTSGGGRL
ncbi:MAG: glycosyltransferase family 9 protein [Bacteroidia bacterium]|nr:glycosyltransferase family 9 protein [Bacteroidia bacterium]